MKNLIGIFIVLLMIAISCTSSEKVVETPQLTDYMDTVSYSVGVDIGKSFRLQEMDINPDVMARGLSDAFSDKETALTDEEIQSTLINFRQEFQQKQREIAQRKAQEAAVAEESYLAESASKEGVVSLPSGLQYKVITPGDGPSPLTTDKVKVHYKGSLADGTIFDSSYDRGQPTSFTVSGVIKGWTEALLLMQVGSKWELTIPSKLGYGTRGSGDRIPPNSTLLFEVELLAIE
ncbi:FKBP-type peptidyl-prolyl cis-trans isomerase FklB [hydrothermal vent metagenome]|uniref:peptidylprolyl isomerase n=1 Tax=hydrothermal vent metagenome TaxID=652676 RepID=A0A160VGX7_9ZZZZ